MININNKNYYSTKELAVKCNVTPETIRIWRLTRGLKYNKIGPKKFIYNETDIEDFLKGN